MELPDESTSQNPRRPGSYHGDKNGQQANQPTGQNVRKIKRQIHEKRQRPVTSQQLRCRKDVPPKRSLQKELR